MKWNSSFKIIVVALLFNSFFACKTKQKSVAYHADSYNNCEVKKDYVPEILPIIQKNEANFH